jgi:hypothetical protein
MIESGRGWQRLRTTAKTEGIQSRRPARMSRPTGLLIPLAVLLLASATARAPSPRRSPGRLPFPGSLDTITRRYDVQLAYIGYTGLAESQDCALKVDAKGYDSLVGTLKGIENAGEPDEDVVYTGTLRRLTKIDYCQSRGRRSPSDDETVLCVATLTAAARMEVELTVYGEDGNGAWLKAEPAKTPPDSVKVKGTCEPADMDSIRVDYPKGESAGSPDGQPIAEPDTLKFALKGIRRLRAGYFAATPPETVWGLRVTKVVP